MQKFAMKFTGKLGKQMLTMWLQKREMERQINNVVFKSTPRPSRYRRCWDSFKIRFYKCFGQCEEDEIPEDTFDQMFYNGTEPNEHLKLFLGYFGALIISMLLCVFLIFKYPWSPRVVGLVCGMIAMFFSYIMFFRLPRCWFLLMMPEFFSNRIRAILILLALSWTMIGPAMNAQLNMRATAEMLACIQEQVNKEGATMKSALKNNLKARAEKFIQAKEDIERTLKSAKDSLKVIYNAFVRMGKVIKKLFRWLDKLVNICNSEAIKPYQNCVDWFDATKSFCKNRWYLGGICYVLEGLKFVACLWPKFTGFICEIPEDITKVVKEQVLEKIKKSLDAAIKKLEDAFEFEVEIKRNVSYQEKFESNMSYFRDEAKQQLENAQWLFRNISYFFDALIWLSFAFMLFKAIQYQRKYVSNPRKDNYFLTTELVDADRQRIRLGKETVQPLTHKETYSYIEATSFGLTTKEKWKLCRPIFTTTASLMFVIFWINFDLILWKVMTEQYVMLMEEGGVDVPNYYKLHVQGTGTMANAFRSLLHAFVPQNYNEGDLSKKWQFCIVEPSVPDFELHTNLYYMMGVCYLTIIFKVYLDRLRHAVCFLFYPEQEAKRAQEMQNKILISRGSWLYFAQKQIANRKTSKMGMAQAAIQRAAASVPLVGKLMRVIGDETKLCFECSERIKVEDLENYRACENPTCGQTYCTDCFYRCPECQSCGENKVPKSLFIDHELPHVQKEENKPEEKRLKEQQLIALYGNEYFLGQKVAKGSPKRFKSLKIKKATPLQSIVDETEIDPELTEPGPSYDQRYNVPPRSRPINRGRPQRFRSPNFVKAVKKTTKVPSPKLGRSPKRGRSRNRQDYANKSDSGTTISGQTGQQEGTETEPTASKVRAKSLVAKERARSRSRGKKSPKPVSKASKKS